MLNSIWKVMLLRTRKRYLAMTWHRIWHLAVQAIRLLLIKASSEMLSVDQWLSRSQSLWREMGRKDWGIQNYTKTGLKWNGNRWYGELKILFWFHLSSLYMQDVRREVQGTRVSTVICKTWINLSYVNILYRYYYPECKNPITLF